MKEKTTYEAAQEAIDRASVEGWHREREISGQIGTNLDYFQREIARVDAWRAQVVDAARKFVKCKGRYHSELNMTALIKLFDEEPR